MKKALSIILLLLFVSCNYQVFDTTWKYDKAEVRFPNGEVKTIELAKWTDYEGERLQLVAKSGEVYLVSSVNCILIKEAK